MKRKLNLWLVLILVISLVAVACSSAPAQAPAKAPEQKAAEAPPKAAEPKPAAPASAPEQKPAQAPAKAPEAAAAPKTPLKIGILAPMAGTMAGLGQDVINGFKLRLEMQKNLIADRQVELVIDDDAGDPATALTKARKQIERDQVEMIVGPFGGNVVDAVEEYIAKQGLLQVAWLTAPKQLVPTVLSPSHHNESWGAVMGPYAYQKMGLRKVVNISSDFEGGREFPDGFKAAFKKAGGEVVSDIWVPLGSVDFGPFLTKVPQADATYSFFPGGDAVRYIQQRDQFGLKARIPQIGNLSIVDESLLPAQGKAAVGTVVAGHYWSGLENAANKEYLKAYTDKYGKGPLGYYAMTGYMIPQLLDLGLKKTNGNAKPAQAAATALQSVTFDSPKGPFRFDAKVPYAVNDYYILKVVEKDGKITYEQIDIVKDVKPYPVGAS